MPVCMGVRVYRGETHCWIVHPARSLAGECTCFCGDRERLFSSGCGGGYVTWASSLSRSSSRDRKGKVSQADGTSCLKVRTHVQEGLGRRAWQRRQGGEIR